MTNSDAAGICDRNISIRLGFNLDGRLNVIDFVDFTKYVIYFAIMKSFFVNPQENGYFLSQFLIIAIF